MYLSRVRTNGVVEEAPAISRSQLSRQNVATLWQQMWQHVRALYIYIYTHYVYMCVYIYIYIYTYMYQYDAKKQVTANFMGPAAPL